MDEPPHSICEQHIHFLGFYDGCDFTLAKGRVHQSLSLTVSSRPVIRRTNSIGSALSCAAAIGNTRSADGTADPRNLSRFAHGSDDVTPLFIASDTHLLDSIPGFENWFVFH
jgi:hypothetical protein